MAIALVPCVALVVTGTVSVVGLVGEARTASRWSSFLSVQIDPLTDFVKGAQDERTTSLAALSGDPRAMADLPAQRAKADAGLAEVATLAPHWQRLAPQAAAKSTPLFASLAGQTPAVRQSVDTHRSGATDIDDFYTKLVGVIGVGLEGLAQFTPDSGVATGELTAADLLQMADFHSRAAGFAAASAAEGVLRPSDRRYVGQLVGAYRSNLDALASRLTADETDRLHQLTGGNDWRLATSVEDALVERGILVAPMGDWQAAEHAVNTQLLALFVDHVRHADSLAADAAHRQLMRSIAAGVGVAVVSIVAFLLALQLANGLVRRLRSLRSRSLELANVTLPSIVSRLHDGEAVDIDGETAMMDDGVDEIGQVASAFGVAQRTAMTAAAAEARTREGFNKVFLDIAYRSQVIVRRQLDVLDVAEAKQDDPDHLELLFRLDHLATRSRRNAENLLILGGAQPGRRWREPVPLEQLVRSAASETEDFTRVNAIRLPDIRVLGIAVADLTHLLAELIDNAASFSPPHAMVSIHGNLVGRGAVIEIEDQGLGLQYDDRARFNELLKDPHDFQEMALAGQRHLGLFVVGRLARRHSISVNLQESAYGGVNAVVLIPTTLLEFDTAGNQPSGQPNRTVLQRVEVTPGFDAAAPPVTVSRAQLPGSDTRQISPPPPSGASAPSVSRHSDAPVGEHEIGGRHAFDPANFRAIARQSGSRAPLPRRERQTHLVPELRVESDQPVTGRYPMPEQRRPAAVVRTSLAAFQRGTRQARQYIPAPSTNRNADNR